MSENGSEAEKVGVSLRALYLFGQLQAWRDIISWEAAQMVSLAAGCPSAASFLRCLQMGNVLPPVLFLEDCARFPQPEVIRRNPPAPPSAPHVLGLDLLSGAIGGCHPYRRPEAIFAAVSMCRIIDTL